MDQQGGPSTSSAVPSTSSASSSSSNVSWFVFLFHQFIIRHLEFYDARFFFLLCAQTRGRSRPSLMPISPEEAERLINETYVRPKRAKKAALPPAPASTVGISEIFFFFYHSLREVILMIIYCIDLGGTNSMLDLRGFI